MIIVASRENFNYSRIFCCCKSKHFTPVLIYKTAILCHKAMSNVSDVDVSDLEFRL